MHEEICMETSRELQASVHFHDQFAYLAARLDSIPLAFDILKSKKA